jgi:hypothetical protein
LFILVHNSVVPSLGLRPLCFPPAATAWFPLPPLFNTLSTSLDVEQRTTVLLCSVLLPRFPSSSDCLRRSRSRASNNHRRYSQTHRYIEIDQATTAGDIILEESDRSQRPGNRGDDTVQHTRSSSLKLSWANRASEPPRPTRPPGPPNTRTAARTPARLLAAPESTTRFISANYSFLLHHVPLYAYPSLDDFDLHLLFSSLLFPANFDLLQLLPVKAHRYYCDASRPNSGSLSLLTTCARLGTTTTSAMDHHRSSHQAVKPPTTISSMLNEPAVYREPSSGDSAYASQNNSKRKQHCLSSP